MPHSEHVGAPSNIERDPEAPGAGSSSAVGIKVRGMAGVAATVAAGNAASPLCVR
jgi:hypothetical protein